MKVEYRHEVNDEEFEELAAAKSLDNVDTSLKLYDLAKEKKDREFNFALLNLGMIMQIVATSIELKQDEIEGYLKLEKEHTRDRKMEAIAKELNERINLRYEFDEDTTIIPVLYTHKGLGYVCFDKVLFLELLLQKDIDIKSLENV